MGKNPLESVTGFLDGAVGVIQNAATGASMVHRAVKIATEAVRSAGKMLDGKPDDDLTLIDLIVRFGLGREIRSLAHLGEPGDGGRGERLLALKTDWIKAIGRFRKWEEKR